MLRKKQHSLKLTLRLKLITFFLLFAFVPLGILAYFAVYSVRTSVAETSVQTLAAVARQIALNVDGFVETNLNNLSLEAQLPVVTDYFELPENRRQNSVEENRLLQTLQNLARKNEYILSYGVLDSRGNNLVDTVAVNIGQIESKDNTYVFEPLQNGETYASPVIFAGSTKQQPVLYFSVPISVGQQIVGVLRVQYNPAILQQIVAQHNQAVGKASFGVLLDENRTILAHGIDAGLDYKTIAPLDSAQITQLQSEGRLPGGPTSEVMVNLPELTEVLRNLDNSVFISNQIDSDNKVSIAAASSLQRQPWTVLFVHQDDALLLRGGRQIFTIMFMLVILIGAIALAAVGLANGLTEPLKRLIEVAQQIAGGALGLAAPEVAQYEAGELAKNFNQVVSQLRQVQEGVERRINERTRTLENVVRSLETTTQIGRQITTILDIDELMQYVVDHLQKAFGFYYTQIYLVNEETKLLVLERGSGEAGQQLKAEGYTQAIGKGIIGTVAKTNEYFLANDVSKVPSFVSLALLPDTRSELALPLRKGGRVVGVLDIQSEQVNRFTPAEVPLFQSIANQTAVAIENARLLAETQVALEEVERLNRQLTRQGWEDIQQEMPLRGYRFSEGKSAAITSETDIWLSPMKQAGTQKHLVKQVESDNGQKNEAELAVPLILRGQVIGVLGVKRRQIPDWSDEEVTAVESVAQQIARALDNARLSKEQEKTIEQLKDVDRLKSEFLTSMSHELRTPLNSIIGFADVLLQGIDGELNDLALNDIRLIYNSGQHLLALINDILDIAKIEAGRMELVHEAIHVEDIINDMLATSNSLIKDKPIAVAVNIAKNLPPVYADKLRLSQILLNLFSNAVKFTAKGQITLTAAIEEAEPDKVSIAVIDTGIGIPADKLDAVFDRFRQADSSTTREYGGSGLGLAICKELVEMHGGQLKAESRVGVGSKFYFTVPIVPQHPSTEAEVKSLVGV
jgi:signal transduction histidine kinase/methyl-accepting chemotaxis protein